MLLSLSDMTCMETNPEVVCATRLMVFALVEIRPPTAAELM